MSSDDKIDLDEREKQFLTLLIQLRKKLRGEDWEESMKKGIRIPDEGFTQKFETHLGEKIEGFDQQIDSLEEKNLIEIKQVKTEKDHAKWDIDYGSDEDSTTLNKEKQVRGKEQKKYLYIPEKNLERLKKDLKDRL